MPELYYAWIAAKSFKPGRTRVIRSAILHSTDGHEAGDIETLTRGKVSAHWYITRAGKLYHFVQDADTAYHAGRVYDQQFFSNAATIGIEQEHIDNAQDWPPAQIDKAARLAAFLHQRHAIRFDRFVAHADVAKPAGRKQDPFAYPWDWFREKGQRYISGGVWVPQRISTDRF